MTRKQFLTIVTAAGLRAQSAGKPVNADEHGMKMSGVNGPTSHLAMAAPPAPPASPLQAVATRSGSNLRHGTYLHETLLTPAVVSSGLKKLFSMKTAGDHLGMEGQPLFMPVVALANGSTHDLCICATMANAVYAFDANTGDVLWKRVLGSRLLAPERSMPG